MSYVGSIKDSTFTENVTLGNTFSVVVRWSNGSNNVIVFNVKGDGNF